MTTDLSARRKYLQKRAVGGPWRIEGDTAGPFAGAVVIPSLAESASLFATLESLAANPPATLKRWQIVVVVNHSEAAGEEQRADNLSTLQRLRSEAGKGPLRLAWADAASPDREVPEKQAGAGMARKIGFDLALAGLDPQIRPLLVALDADTLVDADYLPALEAHFARSPAGGAVLPFCHRREGSLEARQAIETYELYLLAYPFGLHLAGSPYAYPTVGSAMACTADAYVRAGGMNRRAAGEDFYFLQQLAKSGGVEPLRGTVVRPSARLSSRTPFGTGPSLARILGGDDSVVAFHDPRVFDILGRWLRLVRCNTEADAATLMRRAERIHPQLAAFLEAVGFEAAWARLPASAGSVSPAGLHGWFDGLKSYRLVRHISGHAFSPGRPETMVTALLREAGMTSGATIAQLNRRLFRFWAQDADAGGAKGVV